MQRVYGNGDRGVYFDSPEMALQPCVYRNKEYPSEIERIHFVHTLCTRPIATD